MVADIDTQMRAWLSRHVAGEITWEELEGWFAGAAWSAESDLVNDVALTLAETERGDLTPAEARVHFAGLVGQTIVQPGAISINSSSTVTVGIGSVRFDDPPLRQPIEMWAADEEHGTEGATPPVPA